MTTIMKLDSFKISAIVALTIRVTTIYRVCVLDFGRQLSGRDRRGDVIFLVFFILLLAICLPLFFDSADGETEGGRCQYLDVTQGQKLTLKECSASLGTIGSFTKAQFFPFFFEKLPVNSANRDQLMIIKGVGPKLADEIIKSREMEGPFEDIHSLQRVAGIGEKTAESLKEYLSFEMAQ
jgi:competence ComEA-like helix-hairpin-helix protein